ncbi:MAG TPA: hypothetical protein VMP01_25965 [Pirellulaceae bacterium]|nr:hypothetical protein [Pirellulaceae bacterium]
MVEQNSEVDRAISALTAEILKLSPVEGEAKAALSISIGNAFSRLALAIAGQSTQKLEDCLEAMPAEAP